jgi:ATP-dependent DNA ligase
LAQKISNVYNQCQEHDVFLKVIDRNLDINFGKTEFNKIVDKEDKIQTIPYMRLSTYKEDSNISFPMYSQIKADGSYRVFIVKDGTVRTSSRQYYDNKFKLLQEEFRKFPNGVYIGELLVKGMTDRKDINGYLNQLEMDEIKVYIQLWNVVSLDEYFDAKHQDKSVKRYPYSYTFKALTKVVEQINSPYIKLIESKLVNTIAEALEHYPSIINKGLEGTVLKSPLKVFKDHTSTIDFKLKANYEIEVRLISYELANSGSRVDTFSALLFETDDKLINGKVGSGFTDDELISIKKDIDNLKGSIMTVKFYGLSKAVNSDTYSLTHPVFIEFRGDKDTTDTLESTKNLIN